MSYLDQIDVKEKHTFEEVNALFYRLGMTDGLPVVPPTEERVARMLGGRNGDEVVGVLPPGQGEASWRKLAICAVMAGCRPEYLPVLAAAVEAVAQPAFNALGVLTTTGNTAVMLVVNGPAIQRCEMNAGPNALGPGNRANATIGRAFSLAVLNIASATPGKTDMATMGQPAKYGFCFAENEAANPWEPLHVQRGLKREQSAVTAFGVGGCFEVVDSKSTTAANYLTTFAGSMKLAGSLGGNRTIGCGEAILLLAPERARTVARDFSLREVRQFIHDNVRIPLSALSPEVAEHLAKVRAAAGEPEGDLLAAETPEDILVAVVGGVGIKSTFTPTWGGGTRAVTREIHFE